MALNIKITSKKQKPDNIVIRIAKGGKQVLETLHLKARKNLSGDIMIFDHDDIDIVLMTEKKKIVTFAKDFYGEEVYISQNRLFKFLFERGIISQETVQGGNVYASLEAKVLESKKYKPLPHALYTIAKFIEHERPRQEFEKAFDREQERRLSEPLPDESSEFDPKRHNKKKGSIQPGWMPYGLSTAMVYRLEEALREIDHIIEE